MTGLNGKLKTLEFHAPRNCLDVNYGNGLTTALQGLEKYLGDRRDMRICLLFRGIGRDGEKTRENGNVAWRALEKKFYFQSEKNKFSRLNSSKKKSIPRRKCVIYNV